MENLMTWLADNWLVVLTTVVTVCSIIAKATPNETDNKFVSVLQKIIDTLALTSTPTKYTGNKLGFINLPMLASMGLAALLALLLSMGSGCALKNLSSEDKALAVAEEVTNAYMAVRAEYANLRADLPADQSAWLLANVAPILDEGRDVLVLVREAAATWKAYKVEPDDFTALLTRLRVLIADAWAEISKVTHLEV